MAQEVQPPEEKQAVEVGMDFAVRVVEVVVDVMPPLAERVVSVEMDAFFCVGNFNHE